MPRSRRSSTDSIASDADLALEDMDTALAAAREVLKSCSPPKVTKSDDQSFAGDYLPLEDATPAAVASSVAKLQLALDEDEHCFSPAPAARNPRKRRESYDWASGEKASWEWPWE